MGEIFIKYNGGGIETALTFASGAMSTILGSVIGLGRGGVEGVVMGDVDAAVNEYMETLEEVSNKLTYQPMSEYGDAMVGVASVPGELIHKFNKWTATEVYHGTDSAGTAFAAELGVNTLEILAAPLLLKGGKKAGGSKYVQGTLGGIAGMKQAIRNLFSPEKAKEGLKKDTERYVEHIIESENVSKNIHEGLRLSEETGVDMNLPELAYSNETAGIASSLANKTTENVKQSVTDKKAKYDELDTWIEREIPTNDTAVINSIKETNGDYSATLISLEEKVIKLETRESNLANHIDAGNIESIGKNLGKLQERIKN